MDSPDGTTGPQPPSREELIEAANYLAKRYPGTSPDVYFASGRGLASFGPPREATELRPTPRVSVIPPETINPT